MPRIILDGDYGIDDALALLYLAVQPEVEILAIGSVHGNATATAAAHNALAVLDVAGLSAVPVALGAARPIAQPLELAAFVHGDDGLGGRSPKTVSGAVVDDAAAVQLVRLARAHPGECTVIATGPLTNLALALLLEPELPRLLAGIVLMGGTLQAPGNVSPRAEANLAHDPEAAALVFAAGWPCTQVGLDVTMRTWLRADDLERMAASKRPAAAFALGMLEHYLDFYRGRHGEVGCPLHDPTAAYLALHRDAARYQRAPVSVELRSDLHRGMLIADERGFARLDAPDVDLAVEIDSAAVVEGVVAALVS